MVLDGSSRLRVERYPPLLGKDLFLTIMTLRELMTTIISFPVLPEFSALQVFTHNRDKRGSAGKEE